VESTDTNRTHVRNLNAPPVDPFHEWFPPIQEELIELAEITELVSSDSAILVDGRLVLVTSTVRGQDPGGFPV
jgi:hypothetical protein